MSDLKLTDSGDLDFDAGGEQDIQLVTDYKEVLAQRLRIRYRSFKNDWFLNLDDGLPYFKEILKKNPNSTIIEALYKSETLSCPGVLGLNKFEMNLDNEQRQLTIEIEAQTSEGAIPVVVPVPL